MECLLITSEENGERFIYQIINTSKRIVLNTTYMYTIGNLAMKCNEVDPEYLFLIRLD